MAKVGQTRFFQLFAQGTSTMAYGVPQSRLQPLIPAGPGMPAYTIPGVSAPVRGIYTWIYSYGEVQAILASINITTRPDIVQLQVAYDVNNPSAYYAVWGSTVPVNLQPTIVSAPTDPEIAVDMLQLPDEPFDKYVCLYVRGDLPKGPSGLCRTFGSLNDL